MKKDIKKMIEIAENIGWSIDIDKNNFTFQKFSPAGQDFNIEITATDLDEIVEKIRVKCDNFDCSEEAYLWLDNTGHGTNGAPYNMKDLYEDMEACLKMMKELYQELEQI